MHDTTSDNITQVPQEGCLIELNSLRSYLAQLCDPRQARGIRYRLVDLLTLLILAKLSGEDSMKGMAEWVRFREETLLRLLDIPRQRLPHQTTYQRVLDQLEVTALEGIIGAYLARQTDQTGLTVTLDGKVLRGTIPEGGRQGMHLVAAYVPQQRVVLMQVEVADKASELTAAPQILEALDLQDCVVTGDALFTQRDLCAQIVQAGGAYLLPVKANQPDLQQAIADVFTSPAVSPGHSPVHLSHETTETYDCGHGRIEQRYLTVTSELNAYLDWPHLGQVFRLQRVVQRPKTRKITYEVVFGVTSLPPETCSPERLLYLLRQHWDIENRLHYVRDVTFGEDACRIRHTQQQRVLACLNNLAIGLIGLTHFNYAPEARRYFDANYEQALQMLL